MNKTRKDYSAPIMGILPIISELAVLQGSVYPATGENMSVKDDDWE